MQAIKAAEKRTLTAIGVFAEGEAINRAPVDTGNLRGSITHRVEEDHVVIGTPTEYAPYVEKGTSGAKAQAFLGPAVEGNIGRIKQLASEMMKL